MRNLASREMAYTTLKGGILGVGVIVSGVSLLVLLYSTQLRPKSLAWPTLASITAPFVLPHDDSEEEGWPDGSSLRPSLSEDGVERWPGHQSDDTDPSKVPFAVHYLWCEDSKSKFLFKDYLGLLSSLRILRPLTVVFHFNNMPATDDYDTWFSMLQKSLPNMQLQKLPESKESCGSEGMLDMALGFLAPRGGVLLGRGVMLACAPRELRHAQPPFSFHFAASSAKTQGVVFARKGFKEEAARKLHLKQIVSAPATCVSEQSYNELNNQSDVLCISLNGTKLYPKDIMFSRTPFAELARWLFYGKRAPVMVHKDPNNLIPRISHYIRLKGSGLYSNELNFHDFLGILSALYVGGFHNVYLHAEDTPQGQWWEELKKENVTWVQTAKIRSVFSHTINQVAHMSDVIRLLVLYKYGGAYQDFDVLWVSRVNDSLLACPTVMAFDWMIRGAFPEQINNGVMLAQRHSKWLRMFMMTLKDFRDNDWAYNSAFVPYKMFEKYPELICLDRRLQVICNNGKCHQPWLKDYRTTRNSQKPTPPFTFNDANAVHVTRPKVLTSLSSPHQLNKSTDYYSTIARMILERSGRLHLLG